MKTPSGSVSLESVLPILSPSLFGKIRAILLVAWTVLVVPLPTGAALISYEGFGYPVNTAIGARNGGTGWQSGWSGSSTVVAPGLTCPGLSTVANRLQTIGNNNASLRPVTTAGFTGLRSGGKFGLDGTEMWLSFLIRRDAGYAASHYAGVSLFDGFREELFIGGGGGHWGIQLFDLGPAPGNVTAASALPPPFIGETSLLVVRLQFGVNGTQDRVELFVNPAPGTTPPVPDAARTGADIHFDRVRIQSGPGGAAAPASVDEFRLGERFVDVVPGPPGPFVEWLRPGPQTMTAGAELILPLAFAWRDGDLETLDFSVTAGNAVLLPTDRLVITGTGRSRQVAIRPAAGDGGASIVTATVTPPGGAPVSTSFELTVFATPAGGLLAHEPFDYAPRAAVLVGMDGGQGFAGAWSGGVPGFPSSSGFLAGSTNLHYPGLANTGSRMRMSGSSAQAMRRVPALPLGENGTVRYLSLIARPDNVPTATAYFGLLIQGGAGTDLFVGKPGGGQRQRYVLENAGGTGQFPTTAAVVADESALWVVRLEFREGADRISLFVNPPLGAEPTVADAVKTDLDLGRVSGVALNSASPWSADELRLGTTYASVVPTGASFALAPVRFLEGQEHAPVSTRITTVQPLPEGTTLAFALVGDSHGATLDAVTGDFVWVPGELEGGQARVFSVRATSNATPPESDQISFSVQVYEANIPARVTDPGPVLVEEGTPLSLQLAATDPDMPPQNLFFVLVDGPEGMVVSPSGLLSWMPAPQQWDSQFLVTVRADDSFNAGLPITFNVTTRSTGGGEPVAPPPLLALVSGDDVLLLWENTAGSLALQAATGLESAAWIDLAVTPVLSDGMNRVTRPLTNAIEFFRLVSRGGAARLTGLTPPPGPLAPGARIFVVLVLSGELGDGDVLVVSEESAGLIHERRIPGEILRRPDGTLGFYLDGDQSPIGTLQVTARLLNAAGTGRGSATFAVANLPPDPVGQPPVISLATWGGEASAARRPYNTLVTIRPPLSVTVEDPDGDLARLEIRFTDPLGQVQSRLVGLEASGSEPTNVTLFPLNFDRATAAGYWSARLAAFDRAGHSSEVREVQLYFGDNPPFGAQSLPNLNYFLPTSGVPGDVIDVDVSGLADAGPTNARVRIGGRIATVLEATSAILRVIVPTGTAGGLVDVVMPTGTAVSMTPFVVVPAPNVEPAMAHALAGQAVRFGLDRRLSAAAVVAWSVEGGGTIGTDGLFRAPDHLAAPAEVTVTAHITLPGTNLVATARVSVEAAPVARGTVRVGAGAGGIVWSENLLARLVIPAGALAADSVVSVKVPAAARPVPPAGSELLGVVELGPDRLPFSVPAGVVIPLTRSLAPGESMSLQWWNASSGAWVDDGETAVVGPDGQAASADVQHLATYALVADAPSPLLRTGPLARQGIGRPCPGGAAPVITRVTPAFIREGELRPIFIEGSGLDGDVELALVRGDGSEMPGIVLGPLVRARLNLLTEDSGRAGFLLDCPVLPTLGAGQSLALRIRLRKCGSPDASFPLHLHGLPEFRATDLGAANAPENTFAQLYSEIIMNGFQRLPFDVTQLHATHGIEFIGELNVSGRPGDPAVGSRSGVAEFPARFRSGGQGGNQPGGIEGLQNALFRVTYDFPARQMRVGYGGGGGAGVDSFDLLRALAGCVGADARPCFERIIEDLHDDPFGELGDAPADLLGLLGALPDGRRGRSGLWNGAPTHWFRIPSGVISDNIRWVRGFGPGSGGGGGGKSGELMGDPGSRRGGGAGGEGGGAVRILSGRRLVMNGRINAHGGVGGNGAAAAFGGVVVSGGGGGGGGAGAIRVLAGEAVVLDSEARFDARGGPVGAGGIATRLENVGFGVIAELPYAEEDFVTGASLQLNTPEGMNVVEGSLFDETLLANAVVTRGVVTLTPRRPQEFFTFDGRPGLALDPARPHIVVRRADGSESRRCYFFTTGQPGRPVHRIHLLFFPGANVIELGGTDEELLNRHIVYLDGPDMDRDGISDADEAGLGTNPAVADTDGDGLDDATELLNGSDPLRVDADGDLLPDNVEIALGTLPNDPDSDGDGLWDSLEVYRGQSPTEARSSAFSYAAGELFSIVENEAGEKLLALLDPLSGRLGALGRLPGNRGDGITFDPRGTLYLAQGDELFEWAGSIHFPRGTSGAGPIRAISVGGPGSSGGGVVGVTAGVVPTAPAGSGNVIRDFRTIVGADGALKFSKLGDIRSENALGAFDRPVEAGPLTFDPLPLAASRISGVMTTPGVVGGTFFLPDFNVITPPLVKVTLPGTQAPTAIKSLAFGNPTGRFALLAGAGGGSDVLQQVDPYSGGVGGHAFPLGRADGMALIHVATNRFIATTAAHDVLDVQLQPGAGTQTITTLARTVAPVRLLALVPCAGGCFSTNVITGTGPLGPNFRARGFRSADFNGDGLSDLAVLGEDGTQAVLHILHSDGTGIFNGVARHVLGEGRVMASGKLELARANADALPDLIVAWDSGGFLGLGGHVSVVPGTADGKFAAPLPAVSIIPTPEGFAVGQFDGRDTDDLVTANGPLHLRRGNAAGTFGASPGGFEVQRPDNLGMSLVEMADLNGDGNKDLIALGESLAIYTRGPGSDPFVVQSNFGGGDTLELGDYDGDGNTDLFVSGYSGFIAIFPGHGDGRFDPSINAYSGQLVGSVPYFAVADLDFDGRSEVVMPDQYGQRALLLGWDPVRHGYEMVDEIGLASQPIAARIADVNGDGKQDILLLGVAGTIEVVLGR